MAARSTRAVRDQQRHEAYAKRPCDTCGHENGRHGVDYVPAQYDWRGSELVETAPSHGDTISCRVEACGCVRSNKPRTE